MVRKGTHLSQQTKEKMRRAMLGRTPWNKGLPASAEARRKNSEGHKGQPAWNRGIQLSEGYRQKLSAGHMQDPVASFWHKVEKTDTCWVWRGTRQTKGYGYHVASKRGSLAHRFAYQLLVGPIPDGLQVDHVCRNRWCVRPEHMRLVTPRENVLAGIGISAQNARKTHCLRGHPFEGTNLLRDSKGRRMCATCRRQQNRESYQRRKARIQLDGAGKAEGQDTPARAAGQ